MSAKEKRAQSKFTWSGGVKRKKLNADGIRNRDDLAIPEGRRERRNNECEVW